MELAGEGRSGLPDGEAVIPQWPQKEGREFSKVSIYYPKIYELLFSFTFMLF